MSILPAVHQFDVREPIALFFACRNAKVRRLRELAVAVVVVRRKGLFEPEDVVVRESAGALNGGLRIPNKPGVDHEIRVITEPLAGFAHEGDVGLLVFAHRLPAELHGGEAAVAEALCTLARFVGRRAE